jgi:hypothetical protein
MASATAYLLSLFLTFLIFIIRWRAVFDAISRACA